MLTPAKLILLNCLLVLLTDVSDAWGERKATREKVPDTSPQLANVEYWEEEEEDEQPWTWFGMGYESRKPGSGVANSTGAAKGDKK